MGSTVFPASSGGASTPIVGAGTTVVQTQQTKGWYTTTLSAGTYIVNVLGGQGGVGIYSQSASQQSGPADYGWTYYSYANSQGGHMPIGYNALIKVTTSDTYYFGWDMPLTCGPNQAYQWYHSNMVADAYIGMYRYSANASIDKFFFHGRLNSNHYAGIVPWVDTWASQSSATNSFVANYITNQTGRTRPQMLGYFGNKYYVAYTESNYHWYSTDTVTWNQTTTGLNSYTNQMAYANTTGITYYYAAVGDSGVATTSIISSTDGITWGTRTSATGTNGLYGITWGNNLWVAVGQNGQITTSTDTITWSSRTAPQTATAYTHVVYQNGLYFAMQDAPTSTGVNAAVSTNGTTWTAVTMWTSASAAANAGTSAASGNYTAYIPFNRYNNSNQVPLNNLFVGGGYFFFINTSVTNCQLWISTNGTNWGITSLGRSVPEVNLTMGWSTAQNQLIAYGSYNNGAFNSFKFQPVNISIYNSTIS